MNVQPNANINPMNRAHHAARPIHDPRPAGESALFHKARALDKALDNVPDTRADRLERARENICCGSYPPPETIRKIAQLLAMNLDDPNPPPFQEP